MKAKSTILLLLFSLVAWNVHSQVAINEPVKKAAKEQINRFINDLPDGSLSDYGFNSRSEFNEISFGSPIPVYTLKDSTIEFTSTWRVPIIIKGEYRSLLTVVNENGGYQAVDFGAVELAKAFAANKTPKTTGMLRVYEIKKDYLIEGAANANALFIPIEFEK